MSETPIERLFLLMPIELKRITELLGIGIVDELRRLMLVDKSGKWSWLSWRYVRSGRGYETWETGKKERGRG